MQTIEALRDRGVLFLDTPETYYDDVQGRVGEIAEDYDDLKRLRILADRDEDGYCCRSSRRRRRIGRRSSSR